MARHSKQVEYERLNGKYLREADELLARSDLPQASEKLGGAAVEIIKAVAAKRGVTLGTHKSVAQFIERLDMEHPRLNLLTGFHIANSLQINFYEDHYPERTVRQGAEAIKTFVVRLRGLL